MDLEEFAEIVWQKLWLLQLDQLKRLRVESKSPTGTVILFKQITKFKENVSDDENGDVAMQRLKTIFKRLEQTAFETENSENAILISQKAHEEVSQAEPLTASVKQPDELMNSPRSIEEAE